MGDCDICHKTLTNPEKSRCGHWFCSSHFESSNECGITERVCPIDCKGLQVVPDNMLPYPILNTEEPGASCSSLPTSVEEQKDAELLAKIKNEEDRMVKVEEALAREKMLREKQATAMEQQKEEFLAKVKNEEDRRVKAEEALAREKMSREKQATAMEQQKEEFLAKVKNEVDRRVKAEEALAKEKMREKQQATVMEQQNAELKVRMMKAEEDLKKATKYKDAFRKLSITFGNVKRDLQRHASSETAPPKSGEMGHGVEDDRQPEGASASPGHEL
ncbi:uncharacterized protein LOC144874917 [Branchiostoma floridae x Branchiostoma japonicum]